MTAAPTQRPSRALLVAWVHLGVLWSFAIAQPLFGVLSDSPEFFVARDNTAGDIVLLALALVLVPPTLLLLLELPFARAPAARRSVHLVLVAALFAALAIQVLKSVTDSSSPVLIPAALALGIVAAGAYARVPAIPSIITVLGPVPLLFAALFLFTAPVSKLVLPQDDAEASGPMETRTPIVMVVFDEFASTALLDERHRIDAARFPNFGKLAAGSTWYRNATTVSGFTPTAVPTILTARRPKSGALPIASDQPHNVFTYLGPGHSMNVEEPVTALCPESLCSRPREPTLDRWRSLASDLSVVTAHRLAPRDIEERLPAVDQSFEGFRRKPVGESDTKVAAVRRAAGGDVPFTTLQNRPATFQRFLGRVRSDTPRPLFAFLHITLPHIPWEFLPSGQQYPVTGPEIPGVGAESWDDAPELVAQSERRYLLQVGYTDRLLGRLIRRLHRQGLWDRALVVVTADHGVSFKPGTPRRKATPENIGEIAPVPLFIKRPGQRTGRIDSSHIRTADILPTMARALDLKLPWRADPPTGDVEISPVRASYSVFARLRQEALDRELKLVAGSRDDLFALTGPKLRPSGLTSDTRVQIDGRYDQVDPKAPIVPALVAGTLSDEAFEHVAVVVNGRPVAVAPTFRAGEIRFSALIPPTSLRRGRNQVEVYGIRGTRLVKLGRRATRTYALRGDRIEPSTGAEIKIVPEAIGGYVEAFGVERGRLRATGWAARKGAPADRVLVFADGQFVLAETPAIKRPDLIDSYGARALESGYQVAAQLGHDPDHVDIYAVIGHTATRLPRLRY